MRIEVNIVAESLEDLREQVAKALGPILGQPIEPQQVSEADAGPEHSIRLQPVNRPAIPLVEPDAPAAEKPRRARKPRQEAAAEPAQAAEEPAQDDAPAAEPEAASDAQEPAAAAPANDEPLTLEKVREVLTDYQQRHPKKVAATVDLITRVGGAKRLSDTQPDVWPAMVAEARAWLDANPVAA